MDYLFSGGGAGWEPYFVRLASESTDLAQMRAIFRSFGIRKQEYDITFCVQFIVCVRTQINQYLAIYIVQLMIYLLEETDRRVLLNVQRAAATAGRQQRCSVGHMGIRQGGQPYKP